MEGLHILKIKLNIIYIIIFFIAFIAFVSGIFLIVHSLRKSSSAEEVGTLSATNSKVFINNIEIPAYGYEGKVYIAAEDLKPFGADIITSSDENVTLVCENVLAEVSSSIDFSNIKPGEKLERPAYDFLINGQVQEHFISEGYNIILAESIKNLDVASLNYSENEYRYTLSISLTTSKLIEGVSPEEKTYRNPQSETSQDITASNYFVSQNNTVSSNSKIIVLDPGHGKSSGSMSDSEKERYGWIYNNDKQEWGEWRHWKTGTIWQDCNGSGCNGRCTENGSCWYTIGEGDRDIEPEINLQNCLAAKKYLEQMGYTVRMTRTSNNENPSVTQRITYCYPNQNTSLTTDAALFVCIHSNAGGGSGSAYIELSGEYDQKGIPDSYVKDGNTLGKTINDEIVSSTGIGIYGSGKISNMPELIAFCKSPVTCAYLEIGFFDNSSDLSILKNNSDSIGMAIANGINKYLTSH